ncbi:caspase family protein [Scytonema hofmannii]|uniref:nSTAND1 domain-containing NTPase n=1 Tax=Scytonema hofmannii TaxID=34078 RepID=UPI00034952C3|nr:caspase family protein [Scytonema hofmannii]
MFSRNVALIIGINDYTNGISPLQNAVNDAKKLVEILREQHEYRIWVCLNQVATLHNLNKLLAETLPQQVTKDDRLLFYFAGHGIALNGDDGPQGYLIPQDAKLGDINTYLSMVQLHEYLSQLHCRHFLGILDCCFAGAFKWSSNRDLLTAPEVIHQERYDRFITDPAWQVITSAAYDQKALDAFNFNTERGKAGNHSPFAAALIEALAGKADAYPPSTNGQPPGDGVITATELYLYLRDIVEPATQGRRQRQTPGIWPLKKHDKGEYIFLTPGHILNLPPAPPLDVSKNPYRGLESFEEEHSQLFFGRTQLVEKLQNLVKTQPLIVLLGASGSGKSSLVKAGLIPQLRQDKTEKWYILSPIRPGEAPLQALNHALKNAQLPEVAAQNPQKTLAMSIDAWAKNHPNSKLLVFIDQSEEIVTLCQNEDERKEFLQEILKAVNTHNQRLRVILSLRSDFEPQLRDAGLQFVPTILKVGNTVLKNRWQSGRFIVSAMTRAELRQAIEKPAETRVMFFQPDELVEQLIDEVADMPGALPLLSFALSELYLKYLKRQRDAQNKGITIDRALTQEDYQDLGGVIQSLTQRADEEYEALVKENPAYAQIIRQMMLRMVALGGGELARRRVPLSELEYPQQKNHFVKEAIERFTNARLLVKGEDAEGNPYVEPAHDALVRGWQKLLAWKQEDEESLILQRRLTPSAMEWKMLESKQQSFGFQTKIDWLDRNLYGVKNLLNIMTQLVQSGRRSHNHQERSRENPVQFLWNSNPYLDVLNEQLKSSNNWFNQVEVEFVQRSVLQKRKNSAWRWRITFGVMLGLSGLTLLALIGQRQALDEEIIAERQSSETYLQSNQPVLDALVSGLRAGKLLNHWLLQVAKPSEQQQIQITRTLRKAFYTVREDSHLVVNKGKIASVFWKKGQLLLATWENNGTVSILERNQGQLAEINVPPNSVTKVAFSHDGSRVAIARKDGIILLWDWRKTALPRELKAHEAEVTDVVWSPDGSRFASLTASGVARIWDSFGNKLQEFNKPQTEVVGISFDLNNQFLRLTIGRDNRIVCLWGSRGRELEKFTALTRIKKATMSPDGKPIAITYTSEQNGVSSWLWNWEEKKLHPLGNDVLVSFSLDGRLLATTGFDDGTVRLRNWFGEQEGQEFQGHQSQISSLNFRSDGELLATGSNDGKVKLWRVQPPQLSLFKQLPLKVTSASFNSNGTQIATLGTDGKIRILDLSGNSLKVFSSEYDLKGKLSWSPNGKQLAVADKGKILLLDASSGKQEGELPGQYEAVSLLRFSPNSQKLALMEKNRIIRTFNLSNKTEEIPFTWYENIPLSTVVWRQDDNQVKLFVGVIEENENSKARSIRMWDIKTSQQIAISFHKYLRDFKSIHFNNDGTLAAVAKPDATVSIWYMEGDKMGELKADTPSLQSVSFSPRGNVLAVIASDGTMKLWELGDLNKLMVMGCDRLRNYLEKNANVNEGVSEAIPERQEARHLCSDIGKKKLSD